MIKVDLKTRQNLTMLAKAYFDRLLPRALDGEIFYGNNNMNEPQFIYYENHNYYYSLLEYIKENQNNFYNSNAANEWYELFLSLNLFVEVDEIDFGNVEHYTMPVDPNYSERKIDLKVLGTFDESFYKQVKRLYRGYNVSYAGTKKTIIIDIPFTTDILLKFKLLPIIQLMISHDQSCEKFDFILNPELGSLRLLLVLK